MKNKGLVIKAKISMRNKKWMTLTKCWKESTSVLKNYYLLSKLLKQMKI